MREKRKNELHASLKMELLETIQKDIKILVSKLNLELKDNMSLYLRGDISSNKVELVDIKVNLQKSQEIVKKYISILKANVNKETHMVWLKSEIEVIDYVYYLCFSFH